MKAKINLKNIKGYLQAHYRQVLDEFDYLDSHIKEQAEWRLNQVKKYSPECYNSDKCVHCGCQVSSKVFEDRACEGYCYPEMMSKEQWENFTTPEEPYGEAVMDMPLTRGPIIIRDLSKEETLADLMENNPHLSKEELLEWCPEFQEPLSQVVQEPNGHFIVGYDDAPGIKGKKFKVKLSKEQFSGNMKKLIVKYDGTNSSN